MDTTTPTMQISIQSNYKHFNINTQAEAAICKCSMRISVLRTVAFEQRDFRSYGKCVCIWKIFI